MRGSNKAYVCFFKLNQGGGTSGFTTPEFEVNPDFAAYPDLFPKY